MIGAGLVVVTYLNSIPNFGHAATSTDNTLGAVVPFHKVLALGGQRDFTLGRATVDVETFHTDEVLAESFAGQVADYLMYKLPGQIVAGSVVNGVKTISLPSVRPYLNPGLFRYGGLYQLLMHDLQPTG